MDRLFFLCRVFLMLSRLFIAALWSSAGKGLTSWLLLVMFIVFLLLSLVISCMGEVWYLIVSFHDLCRLSYFDKVNHLKFLFKLSHHGVKGNTLN